MQRTISALRVRLREKLGTLALASLHRCAETITLLCCVWTIKSLYENLDVLIVRIHGHCPTRVDPIASCPKEPVDYPNVLDR